MARSKVRNLSQEVLAFDEAISLPKAYDLNRAKEAAKRRNQRVGKKALERTRGFRRRTDNLFVPHSGTENSAVVRMPEAKVKENKLSAEERVRNKYQDTEVSTDKVNLWAAFAKFNAEKSTRYNFKKFENEAQSNAMRIAFALDPETLIVERDAFDFDPEYRINPDSHTVRSDVLGYNSVLKYVMDLEAFGGTNPELFRVNGTRVWPIMAHKNVYKEKMEKAHSELSVLADDVFIERVDEAYWSHFSRALFWTSVDKQHREFVRKRNIDINKPPEPLPIVAYENAPDAYNID